MTAAERPSEADVEALATVLWEAARHYDWPSDMAHYFLASDWLAAHDAQVRADRDAEWVEARDRLADEWESQLPPRSSSHLNAGIRSATRHDARELRALAPTPREDQP